jgi:transcriptional regulator with XRE-family HTH domain
MKQNDEISDIISCIVGANISRKREELGISLDELSSYLDTPRGELAALEAGRRRPDPRLLLSLARRLNVTLGYFFAMPEGPAFGGESSEPADAQRKNGHASAAVIGAFARIKNSEPRDIVLDIAQVIAKLDSDK